MSTWNCHLSGLDHRLDVGGVDLGTSHDRFLSGGKFPGAFAEKLPQQGQGRIGHAFPKKDLPNEENSQRSPPLGAMPCMV